jgi:2-isopropylmalate synthase
MKFREENKLDKWTVPYLPIDPKDVGRKYETDVIRINSQSGKGCIGYVMEKNYGFDLPKKMREVFGYMVKYVSDHSHKELMPDEIYEIFEKKFLNLTSPIKFIEAHYIQKRDNILGATLTAEINGKQAQMYAEGNGRLDAVSNAIKSYLDIDYVLGEYAEHSMQSTSKAKAVTYISISHGEKTYWGVGINTDIQTSSVFALISAINAMLADNE